MGGKPGAARKWLKAAGKWISHQHCLTGGLGAAGCSTTASCMRGHYGARVQGMSLFHYSVERGKVQKEVQNLGMGMGMGMWHDDAAWCMVLGMGMWPRHTDDTEGMEGVQGTGRARCPNRARG